VQSEPHSGDPMTRSWPGFTVKGVVDGATLSLRCFDTVGLAMKPVKSSPEMTYYVSSGTLNLTNSPN